MAQKNGSKVLRKEKNKCSCSLEFPFGCHEKTLSDGYKVKLMDISLFSQLISCPGLDNSEYCTKINVFAKIIYFTADNELKKNLPKAKFEKV